MKQNTFNVARVMVISSCAMVINEVLRININGVEFHIKIMEDSIGPLRLMVLEKKVVTFGEEEADSGFVSSSDKEEVLVVFLDSNKDDIKEDTELE
ncbi:unnamed protein product [Lathyrus sativus]|nr:unnamed protein product [Lathyrus sativus]